MNTDERTAEIIRLKEAHKDALAAPRMMDGNISPMQVGMMSEKQRAKWSRRVQEGFDVEAQIRLLERTDEQIADDERKERERKANGRRVQIDSMIQLLSGFTGKNGKIRPKYAREIESLTAERAALA